jgi:hypothetical protein
VPGGVFTHWKSAAFSPRTSEPVIPLEIAEFDGDGLADVRQRVKPTRFCLLRAAAVGQANAVPELSVSGFPITQPGSSTARRDEFRLGIN